MLLGVLIQDVLEGGILALFALVIALDSYLSFRDRAMLTFNIFQILWLVAGYFWAMSVFEQQDVAGPWAWGKVVGIWALCVLIIHIWYVAKRMLARS